MIMMIPIIRNFLTIKHGEINKKRKRKKIVKRIYEEQEIYLFHNIIINILLLSNII